MIFTLICSVSNIDYCHISIEEWLINQKGKIKFSPGRIFSGKYSWSPSNKESGNEPILEDNTDHIDSENEIVHELLDVEFEQLQRCYQHLLDQSPNQSEHTITNDQCSNETAVTKGYKVTESNAKNVRELTELNKVTPPLKKAPSWGEQLTKVRKNITANTLLSQIINNFYRIILFQKVHVSLQETQYWLE